MDTRELTLATAAAGLAAKEYSAVELAQACLDAAKAADATTHAYVEHFDAEALAAAKDADARRAAGQSLSPLDGLPIAVKDNMCARGHKASCGSAILKDYVAAYDGTAVARLKASGAVVLGRTNMDEFAMGSSTETSVHGPTRNPWDTSRIPGGSSGGSAVAVAEGSALASLGSDTGGSIRQPAAMCGVVGLKPTYGRVSRYGLIAMASSLDQIGPFAKTARDAAMLLSAVEGRDPMDATSAELKPEWALPTAWRQDLKGVRVGLPKEYFKEGMNPGVEKAVRAAVAKLQELGAEVKEVSLPHADTALAVYYVLMPSEVSANLARFDGIRYGARVTADSLEETYRQSRGLGFGKEVRRRIMLGTYALSSGYYDAYYKKALQVRRLISNDFAQALTEVDAIITPTSPMTAWKQGELLNDPLAMYLADIYTVPVNIAGLPGVSVPCGLSDGLPVGLQIIGKHFDERRILEIADAYEQAAGPRALPPRA
jgi:aspartyl-tRNA(Asn)/glutamyl-tRNA(Gln) amidotransferase subunit A